MLPDHVQPGAARGHGRRAWARAGSPRPAARPRPDRRALDGRGRIVPAACRDRAGAAGRRDRRGPTSSTPCGEVAVGGLRRDAPCLGLLAWGSLGLGLLGPGLLGPGLSDSSSTWAPPQGLVRLGLLLAWGSSAWGLGSSALGSAFGSSPWAPRPPASGCASGGADQPAAPAKRGTRPRRPARSSRGARRRASSCTPREGRPRARRRASRSRCPSPSRSSGSPR